VKPETKRRFQLRRRDAGVSQADLAAQLGKFWSAATISGAETGHIDLSRAEWGRLNDALDKLIQSRTRTD